MHYSQRIGTGCAGKVTYETIGECERAMRKMRAKWRVGKRHHNAPYHCNACQGYHTTSMVTPEERHIIKQKGGPKDADPQAPRRPHRSAVAADQNRTWSKLARALVRSFEALSE